MWIKEIGIAAWNGQLLAQLTLIWIFQTCLYYLVGYGKGSLLVLTTSIVIIGYGVLLTIVRHAIRTIFNRNVTDWYGIMKPTMLIHWIHLLRPLETIWRCLTYRVRVLPEVLILGEVRCGTTSLCHLLLSSSTATPPFCLWNHPELDKKETFYFVGHYLGHVSPICYPMCFPTIIWKWIQEQIFRQAFFTVDGCAQYLSSPTAPHLIAQTYQHYNQPPPILIACVRHPVDQAISWWDYEHAAMTWGSSTLGLSSYSWNADIRSTDYPPKSISEALKFSQSDFVTNARQRAKKHILQQNMNGKYLPPWAMTWPGGQLSTIGLNGFYTKNIDNYQQTFTQYFGPSSSSYVHIVPTHLLSQNSSKIVTDILKKIEQRKGQMGDTVGQTLLNNQIDTVKARTIPPIHRNSAPTITNDTQTKDEKENDRTLLQQYFTREIKELETRYKINF